MDWYYEQDGQRIGPVSPEEFEASVLSGSVHAETPVWRSGLGEWMPYGSIAPASAAVAPPAEKYFCTECGNSFAPDDMMHYGTSWVCVNCKPMFAQRLREGAAQPAAIHYGGFWIRFLAVLIDGILLGVVSIAIRVLLSVAMGTSTWVRPPAPQALPRILAVTGIGFLIDIGIGICYQVYFLTERGATPGKIAVGLKVVTSNGGPISAGRAVGRYFGQWLSGMTLTIGYIIAGFDSEKRALHDHVCDTRVIYSK